MHLLLNHKFLSGVALVSATVFVVMRGYAGATAKSYVTQVLTTEIIPGVGF